jgi:Tfp pilus assembly PilM family ATPase
VVVKDSAVTPGERLLAMIRPSEPVKGVGAGPAGEASDPGAGGLFSTIEPLDGPAVAAKPAGKPARARSRRLLSFGGKAHVGVDISRSQIVCVKTRGQDADYEILGTAVTPLAEGVEPGTPEFVDSLRRALSGLCGPGPVPRIWASSQTARVNIQFVTIPKVASRQVDNAVFWTAKKEMGFDEGTSVFDFERRGEVSEEGAERLGALAYTADRDLARRLRDDFAKAGYPLAGLTMEPFCHQNLFRRHLLSHNGEASAVLHVGRNWSRLEIGAGGNLIFVRVIKTSMAGMEQAVLESLEARGAGGPVPAAGPTPAQGPVAAQGPEESVVDLGGLGLNGSSLVLELDMPLEAVASTPVQAASARAEVDPTQAREVLRCLVYGCDDLDESHPGKSVDAADIMDMLRPAASRLVRQVEMTLKHFRESLGYQGVTRLAVSGLLGASAHFVAYIGEQLGLPCLALDPVGDYLARGRDVPDITAPGVVYAQALGLALSDPAITPNVLFTYRDKAAGRAARALEQWTLVGLALVLAGMTFFSMDALWTRRRLATEYEVAARQLAELGGRPDLPALTERVEAVRNRRDAARVLAGRARIPGLWGEALALAPEGVGLGTLTAECGPPKDSVKARPGKEARPDAGRLVLEGMVTGDGRLFDSRLASYVVALEHSPLFEGVSVKKSELETLDGGASGLHFVIALGLAEGEKP